MSEKLGSARELLQKYDNLTMQLRKVQSDIDYLMRFGKNMDVIIHHGKFFDPTAIEIDELEGFLRECRESQKDAESVWLSFDIVSETQPYEDYEDDFLEVDFMGSFPMSCEEKDAELETLHDKALNLQAEIYAIEQYFDGAIK